MGKIVKGTDTILFINYENIPKGIHKDITLGCILVDLFPKIDELNHNKLTVRGNLIDYPGGVSTPIDDITTSKIVLNSVVSTPKTNYMCIGLKFFYLGTPLTRHEYLRIKHHLNSGQNLSLL